MNHSSSNRLKILLVEDDELSQRLFCLLFDRLGHNVEVASNGADAVAAVKDGNYDLVFMDIRMPIMGGLEATRRIRALEGDCSKIPIIAITASDLQGEERSSLAAGMNDHVHKPFDLKRIQQIIDAFRIGKFQGSSPDLEMDIPRNKKFLGEFLQGLPKQIQMLDDELQVGDWKKLGIDAHNLKGLSAYFGAMKLSNLAARLDKLAESQASGEAIKVLQEIKDVASELIRRGADIALDRDG